MNNIDNLTINTLRMLSVDMIGKANSGHPGLPLGAAPMAYALFKDHLKFNPNKPHWSNRDRFVLSAGHGSALLYSLLHVFGYELSMDDLKDFRQLNSKTPGHPEYGHTLGVDATSGPLGQGLAMAVGMALAEAHLHDTFKGANNPVDHYTYALVGDGCLMEGISHEAASFAGSHKLGKLIVLYDSNNITIDGSTDITFADDTLKRFEAYGWHTQKVEDGTDIEAISTAISKAKEDDRPSLIEIKTVIGFGAGSVEGKNKSHGAPLKEDDYKILKERLGWNYDSFTVPQEVRDHVKAIIDEKVKAYDEYKASLNELKTENSERYEKFVKFIHTEKDVDLSSLMDKKEKIATRAASGKAIQEVAKQVQSLVGGSADLAGSNNTTIDGQGFISKDDYSPRNIHFGIREFAMAAISNGMALHGGVRPYCATFFVFSDYMKAAMRLSALMDVPVVYVLTHDSIGVGEDGPTHQPIEQLAMLRSLPNFTTIRPADYNETIIAWEVAIKNHKPTALVLTRQGLPTLDINARDLVKGAYIAKKENEKLDAIVIATGSELSIAMDAAKELEVDGIGTRVVSMPSWDLFEDQTDEYKLSVLPKDTPKVSVEALSTFGWDKYTQGGIKLGMDSFGASGKGGDLFEHFKINSKSIVEAVKKSVK